MIFTKDLLVKGIAGLSVCAAAVGTGYHFRSEIRELIKGDQADSREYLKLAGLKCEADNICSLLSENQKISVKHNESTKEEGKSFNVDGSSAKLKLHLLDNNDSSYPKRIKLVVEGGDITLTSTGNASSISKLNRYETYAIEEIHEGDEKKYFLVRKSEAKDEIKKILGLPKRDECNLPTETASPTNCDSITAEELGKINFEGKTVSLPSIAENKKAKLTITRLTSQEVDFPLNYKFVLEPSDTEGGRITIPTSTSSTISINTGEKVELKIKEEDNSNGLSLERFWNISKLTEKVGLEGCTTVETNGTECIIKNSSLNVKHGDSTKEKNKTKSSGTGKIKVYSGAAAEGYNEGFKFVIEEADITLSSTQTTITKLEEFETYEIKEDTGSWYLTRKEKSSEAKRRLLGIPSDSNCNFPESGSSEVTCTLTVDKLKAIRFNGKGEGEINIEDANNNPTLDLKIKISNNSEASEFPQGYKFILESNKNITIPGTSPITIKKGTNTELKINKSADHRTLTLEKAWTLSTLAAKVGLTCPVTGTTDECTLKDSGININNGSTNKYSNLSRGAGNDQKKVKYAENVEGFSQGFKFYTEETDGITLQDSAGASDNNKKIEYKGESDNVHYQILKDADNNWYLTKKTQAPAA